MKLTCYIVDDELHAVTILIDYIEKTPGLELVGYSTNALHALSEVSGPDRPDIIFADVDMPELNGLRFADLVNSFTKVIFTTAYREYAAEAFEKRASDFLVKPIFYERFLESVTRLRETYFSHPSFQQAAPDDFFVSTGTKGKMERIIVPAITYIQGADSYVIIHSKNGKMITNMTMGDILKKLPVASFSRIHKSYIVNHHVVRIIEPGQVTLFGDVVLPVGPSYKAAFQDEMKSG